MSESICPVVTEIVPDESAVLVSVAPLIVPPLIVGPVMVDVPEIVTPEIVPPVIVLPLIAIALIVPDVITLADSARIMADFMYTTPP